MGHFIFDTTGICYLTVFSAADVVSSEQISFQLDKN